MERGVEELEEEVIPGSLLLGETRRIQGGCGVCKQEGMRQYSRYRVGTYEDYDLYHTGNEWNQATQRSLGKQLASVQVLQGMEDITRKSTSIVPPFSVKKLIERFGALIFHRSVIR